MTLIKGTFANFGNFKHKNYATLKISILKTKIAKLKCVELLLSYFYV